MYEIEQKVRQKLGERERRKVLTYLQTHPEYKNELCKKVRELIEQYGRNLACLFFWDPEMAESLRENAYKQARKLEKNLPKELAKEAECVYLKNTEMVEKEVEEKLKRFEEHVLLFKLAGTDIDIESIKSVMYEAKKFSEVIDTIVAKLTEIAKEEGVDNAVRDETIYKVIRELFPTEQDYRKYVEERNNYPRRYRERINEILASSDKGILKLGALMGECVSEMSIIMEPLIELNERLEEEEIKKIYHEPQRRSTEVSSGIIV